MFTTVKQPHVDTRQLTDDVAEAFAEVEASLPADIVVNSELFRLKNFIDRGIFNVAEALVIGAMLVIIVLFLFLLNFRTTFITLTAIPLSLVMTTLVFRLIGCLSGSELSINVMTLGGIAVAMGELVDDAIVDVENIFRRLKENNKLPIDRSKTDRSSWSYSKPVERFAVRSCLARRLSFCRSCRCSHCPASKAVCSRRSGVAYIVSILASFVVSMTVTPVLVVLLCCRNPEPRTVKATGFFCTV